MEKLVIHKNKTEVFKCQFEVDGLPPSKIAVRLCLEFDNNKNMFFNGTVSDKGECKIVIPKLTEVDDCTGKLIVEAIAESAYFKLYECSLVLKNSVSIKMNKPQANDEPTEAKIKISEMKVETDETIQEAPQKSYWKKPEEEPEIKGSKFAEYLRKARSGI